MSQTLPKGYECLFANHLPRMADCIKFHLQNISPLNRLPESPKRPIKSLAITSRTAAASIATEPSVFTFVYGGFEEE
uniref:Uncharacterized protein n=1 Tax=Arabidopsis thaliana TaxID=3702 RepID=Q8LCZ5_ARATH|nr:unknown [Arabidopsis thaliana]